MCLQEFLRWWIKKVTAMNDKYFKYFTIVNRSSSSMIIDAIIIKLFHLAHLFWSKWDFFFSDLKSKLQRHWNQIHSFHLLLSFLNRHKFFKRQKKFYKNSFSHSPTSIIDWNFCQFQIQSIELFREWKLII